MDPLSALLAGFLQSAGDTVAQRAFDGMNAQPETVAMEYQGEHVRFQHQLWRIKPETVCAEQRHQLAAYARCTQAAQVLFRDACESLSREAGRAPIERGLRAMYCNAAQRFVPTEARIQWSDPETSAAESDACRLAKAMLVVDKSAANRAQVREACKP